FAPDLDCSVVELFACQVTANPQDSGCFVVRHGCIPLLLLLRRASTREQQQQQRRKRVCSVLSCPVGTSSARRNDGRLIVAVTSLSLPVVSGLSFSVLRASVFDIGAGPIHCDEVVQVVSVAIR